MLFVQNRVKLRKRSNPEGSNDGLNDSFNLEVENKKEEAKA